MKPPSLKIKVTCSSPSQYKNPEYHHLQYIFLFSCTSELFLSLMYRNRLESNAEHWNALLLSLRELIEWVIRKDTELTGLGPIGGDVACLQKQQVKAMKHIKTCFCAKAYVCYFIYLFIY